jgi:hypothetical protein
MVEKWFFEKLKNAVSPVTVRPGFLDENEKTPAVFYALISKVPLRTFSGSVILRATFQVTVSARTMKEAKEQAEKIADAFKNAEEEREDLKVIDSICANEVTSVSRSPSFTEPIYLCILDVRIIYEEVI